MTNAELIYSLRYCFEKRKTVVGVPWYVWCDRAADALEAAEQRIAELERQHGEQLTRNVMLTVKIPKDGEWIKFNNPNYSPFEFGGEYLYQCNRCGKVIAKATNYCPNCGAKMRGEHDEQ